MDSQDKKLKDLLRKNDTEIPHVVNERIATTLLQLPEQKTNKEKLNIP